MSKESENCTYLTYLSLLPDNNTFSLKKTFRSYLNKQTSPSNLCLACLLSLPTPLPNHTPHNTFSLLSTQEFRLCKVREKKTPPPKKKSKCLLLLLLPQAPRHHRSQPNTRPASPKYAPRRRTTHPFDYNSYALKQTNVPTTAYPYHWISWSNTTGSAHAWIRPEPRWGSMPMYSAQSWRRWQGCMSCGRGIWLESMMIWGLRGIWRRAISLLRGGCELKGHEGGWEKIENVREGGIWQCLDGEMISFFLLVSLPHTWNRRVSGSAW